MTEQSEPGSRRICALQARHVERHGLRQLVQASPRSGYRHTRKDRRSQKALAGKKYDRALDVGIGNGRLLPIYAPHAAHVTGMDISSEQLDQATQAAKKLGVPFRHQALPGSLANRASR